MRHYATLFDSKYLPQGLVLYQSLKNWSSEEFTLWVLAMDDECLRVLEELDLPNVEPIHLRTFERTMNRMDKVRTSRTWQEFCWTCASVFLLYITKTRSLDEITYLDADLMFFSDPKSVFDEIGSRTIAIVPHRFSEDNKHLLVNGRFNVSWVTFRCNEVAAEACLFEWAAHCRRWCFARNEAGKFGDQGYLDAWPTEYSDHLRIIQNPGVGLAPWNIKRYALTADRKSVYADDHPVVFYHYHEFRKTPDGFCLSNYELNDTDFYLIYKPYIAAYNAAEARLASLRVSPGGSRP